MGPARIYSELPRSFWSAPFFRTPFRNVKNEPGSAREAPKLPQGYQNGAKMTPKRSSGTCFFGNRRKCDFEQPSYEKAILLRFAAVWKVTKSRKKNDAEHGAPKKKNVKMRPGTARVGFLRILVSKRVPRMLLHRICFGTEFDLGALWRPRAPQGTQITPK